MTVEKRRATRASEQVVLQSAYYTCVAIDLWIPRHIAAYLKRSVDTVRDDIIALPSFPRPIRLPVQGTARAQALFKVREVIAWAERHTSR